MSKKSKPKQGPITSLRESDPAMYWTAIEGLRASMTAEELEQVKAWQTSGDLASALKWLSKRAGELLTAESQRLGLYGPPKKPGKRK